MSTEQGFAIRRNGSCLSGLETDCGETLAPFRGCCPSGYACPAQYNIACCISGSNCTSSLLAVSRIDEIKCANATWDLFDNGGYFCCEHGLGGYNNQNTNGCARRGDAGVPSGVEWLSTVRTGVPVASATSSSSAVSLSPSFTSGVTFVSLASPLTTDANDANTSSSSSSSTNTGAIAGGVVGGVAFLGLLGFLTWFLLRRRKQKQSQDGKSENPYMVDGRQRFEADYAAAAPTATKYRYDAPPGVYEMPGESPSELGAEQKPVELPLRKGDEEGR